MGMGMSMLPIAVCFWRAGKRQGQGGRRITPAAADAGRSLGDPEVPVVRLQGEIWVSGGRSRMRERGASRGIQGTAQAQTEDKYSRSRTPYACTKVA